ncbi:SIR2 family protein [Pseudomonas sp. COW5]|uniref:SIR2 family protein n=1 Tax=Pseudomonas sp. COW5 TaxID=2981253 RepID=UPI0022458CBA|nr:SIR2 family protein [Pseudomonas sp. COW5]MCX2545724.1 SIR2 family protein [Pseudomonas sp. COW5]
MEFEKILENIDNQGTRGYYLIEALLLGLLKIHLQAQDKPLKLQINTPDYGFDAFAPEGFDEFDGPTFIQITLSSHPKKILLDIEKMQKNFPIMENTSVLIITTKKPNQDILKNHITPHSKPGSPFHIWGPEKISSLIEKYPEQANKLIENIFTIRLETAFSKQQENWKDERAEIVERIKSEYKSGQFSLLLGAGVSSSAGLPDWNTLLNSLFVALLTSELGKDKTIDSTEISSIVKRLREVDGPSALMSARYIRKGMSTNGSSEQTLFVNTVTKQLYELRDKRKNIESKLIKSIASMCTPGRTGAKVKSVITYNFDDLLERQLGNREIQFRSIFEEIEIPNTDELPIYHVHGFLPEDRSNYSNLDRSTLVFSEEGYHKIYNEPYHWSNLIQLNSLKESTCVMIGLSMSDPNLRRLLEIAARSIEKPKHYAFMQRINIEYFSKHNDKKIINAPISTIKTFLDRHHSLNEEVLKELGVNIIWYEEYDDIPQLLEQISKRQTEATQ